MSTGPLRDLPTERPNPRAGDLDIISTTELLQLVFEEDRRVPEACMAAVPDLARLADRAASSLTRGGRMVYVGAGSSGRLGVLDAVELLPTFGLEDEEVVAVLAGGPQAMFRAQESAEDSRLMGRKEMERLRVGERDVVIGISASGRTPFTEGALECAASRRAGTALLTCNPPPSGYPADYPIVLDTGPEVLAGSTRMKAGSATKMALNALSLAVMTRLGKVYGNRMIDLRMGSRKLQERAMNLLCDLGGVERNRATLLLGAAGGNVKTAIVMARTGLDVVEARQRLEFHGGFLRQALREDET